MKKFENVLICPKCAYEFSHITAPPKAVTDEGNQGGYKIQFTCENDHVYYVIMTEHKGNVFVWTEVVQTEYTTHKLTIKEL